MKNYILIISLLVIFYNVGNSQLIYHQTDWSDGQYSSVVNINPDISPGELVLENETSNMILAFCPTTLTGIWDLLEFDGKLFLAACSRPLSVDDGEIISYDYSTNSFQWEYDVWEQGVVKLRKYNNKLYIPGIDSQGTHDFGNIYIFDGDDWIRKETIPYAVHVFDLIFYNSDMYVSTGNIDNRSGKVFKSDDEGDSWIEVFSVEPEQGDFRRLLFMGIYNDTLYVQSDCKNPENRVLFYSDGSNWSQIQFNQLIYNYGLLDEFQNKFYFLNRNYLHIYDGTDWNTVNLPFSGNSHSKGFDYYNGKFYGGAENGYIYSSYEGLQWDYESELGDTNDEIESIEKHHGRLYISTNNPDGFGKVFVSASKPDGYLISTPYNYGEPVNNGFITWNAMIPSEQTSIKFQIKTALTENELEYSDFVGPDGTLLSYYENPQIINQIHSGDQWIQYKVNFNTFDISLMPILQDVNIAFYDQQQQNYAISFDGIDDYIIILNNEIINSDYLTAEAWLKIPDTTLKGPWISHYDLNEERFYINIQEDNSIQFAINTEDGEKNFISFNTVPMDEWFHLAGTYDGSGLNIYLNGELTSGESSGSGFGPLKSTNSDLYFGKEIGGSQQMFAGTIDEVRLWNFSLSQTQIQEKLYEPLNGDEQGLIGYWKINEGIDSLIVDTSIYDNHGTVSGASWSSDSFIYPPRNLTMESSYFNISLSWQNSFDEDIFAYKIYRDTIQCPTTEINMILYPDTLYTDTNADFNKTYYYRITTYTGTGNESKYSNEVSASLLPLIRITPPSSEYTMIEGDSIISTSFIIDNRGGGPLSYNIIGSDSLNPGPPCSSILSFYPSSGTLNAGFRIDQIIDFEIDCTCLIDGFYNTSIEITHNAENCENFIIPINIIIDRIPPNKVTEFDYEFNTDPFQIILFWDSIYDIDNKKYEIYKSNDPEQKEYLDYVNKNIILYIDNSIPDEELIYYYWIRAIDINGNEGEFSDSIAAYLPVKFTADKLFGYDSLDVSFNDLTKGTVLDRYWDFENDGFYDSNQINPSYTYNIPGIYNVKLKIIRNTKEDSLIKHNYIIIQNEPLPPPENVEITVMGEDILLSWSPIDTLDLYRDNLYYIIYNSPELYEDFIFLDYTLNDTFYTHNEIVSSDRSMFYIIIGFNGSFETLSYYIQEHSRKSISIMKIESKLLENTHKKQMKLIKNIQKAISKFKN